MTRHMVRFTSGGLLEGKGFEKFASGAIYQGDFKNGKACGKGVYKMPDGYCYDGEWLDGLQHGKFCDWGLISRTGHYEIRKWGYIRRGF